MKRQRRLQFQVFMVRNFGFGLPIFLFLSLNFYKVSAQPEEAPSRLHFEKDWVEYEAGTQRPDTVKKLRFANKESLDTLALKKFISLKGIIAEDVPLENLEFLAWFPQIEIIELKGNYLGNIRGIEKCKNLKEVGINSNFIQDISLLSFLPQLTYLSLYENDIREVKPIRLLKELTFLELGLNPVEDISCLENLKKLTGFSIYKCKHLKEISVISHFKNLHFLNISFLETPNLSLAFLAELTQLNNLRIQGVVRNNDELNYISNLTRLMQLSMGMNDGITQLDSLYRLSNLEYLDLHSNKIESIAVFPYFPHLYKVVMYSNRVKDLSPLAACKGLKVIFLHDNPIQDYSPLYTLQKLQSLDLSKKDFNEASIRQLRRQLPRVRLKFW